MGSDAEQGNTDNQVFSQSKLAVHGARAFVGCWGVPHGTMSAYNTTDGSRLWQVRLCVCLLVLK